MEQIPAFYDDHFHALRAAIEGGRGYKETAAHLWPNMKIESAYARLKKCTHADNEYKLDLSEVLAVCRFNDRFDPLYYLCRETMHEIPKRNEPADVAQTLAQVIAANCAENRRMTDRLEALVKSNPGLLKSVA